MQLKRAGLAIGLVTALVLGLGQADGCGPLYALAGAGRPTGGVDLDDIDWP